MGQLKSFPSSRVILEFLERMEIGGISPTNNAWPMVQAYMPEGIDQIIMASDSGGSINGKIQKTGEAVTAFRIQIMVKAVSYNVAWVKAKDICARLSAYGNKAMPIPARAGEVFVNKTVWFQGYTVISPPTYVGVQQLNERSLFSMNGLLNVREN